MDENAFRETLTREELEKRAYIISFKVINFAMLERLNRYSTEFEKTWDELINTAIQKLIDDIETVHNLRG